MMKKADRPNREADYAAVYRMNVIYIVVKKENLRRQSYVIAVTDRHDSANGFFGIIVFYGQCFNVFAVILFNYYFVYPGRVKEANRKTNLLPLK